MQIKLVDVINNIGALGKESQKAYPIKLSYAIAKNMKKLAAEQETMSEQRMRSVEKYCVKDTDGKLVVEEDKYIFESEDKKAAFNAEIEELVNTMVEVEIMKVNFDDLVECGNDKYDVITGADIEALSFMIE